MSDSNHTPVASGSAPEGQAPESLEQYQQFFKDIAPILEKLDSSDVLVQALLDGKISDEFAQAALDGKLSVGEATAVSAAVEAVRADVGSKNVDEMDADKLASLIDSKIESFKQDLTQKQSDERFEEYTNHFISTTSDWEKFSDPIATWLKDHPTITDIKVAYYAVKGELSEKGAKEAADADAASSMKDFLLNASGGGVTARFAQDGSNLVDHLIAGRTNPNQF